MTRLDYKPKFDKIVELLLYMVHVRPNADQYQAVKFLYLADCEHLNRYGRPITFETYCALLYGPVASHALNMIKGDRITLRKAGIDKLPIKMKKLDKIIYLRAPEREVNYDVFSKSDLKVFDEILKKYGAKNFGQLYEITHSHFAYKNAWQRRGSSKSVPMRYEDMLLAGPISKAGFMKEDVVAALEATASHM